MAGNYPDVPGRRMAWDGDGSVMIVRPTSGVYAPKEATANEMASVNDEGDTGGFNARTHGPSYFVAIFPELREVDGFYGYENANQFIDAVRTSGDTTNGVDGTWTTQIADFADAGPTYAHYRTDIAAMAVSNVRGLSATAKNGGNNNRMSSLHIYGEISAGQTPDRLLWIDEATGLEYTAAHDYGDIPRGGSEDTDVRLKNNSATLTANTIQYTTEDLYLGAAAWFTYTLPAGSTFQATQQITSLAAATTTGIITVRRITPAAEGLGLYAARSYVNVGSWT